MITLGKAVRFLVLSDGDSRQWSHYAIRFAFEESQRDQSLLNLRELLRSHLGFGKGITP